MDRSFIARPAEPQQTQRKQGTSNDDRRQPPLGDGDSSIGFELLVVVPRVVDDVACDNEDAHDHSKEREAGNTWLHVMNTLEDKRISGQEEVEEAIDEGHVAGDGQDDRFGNQEPEWTRKVLSYKLSEVHLHFLLFCVNAPILSSATQLGGFTNQYHRCVGFFEQE